MAKLTSKARQTIAEIDKGEFHPRKTAARRGTYRLFTALPQHHFTTRYMPIDTTILHSILSRCWKKYGYPDDVAGHVTRDDFKAKEKKWWSYVFRLKRLGGTVADRMGVPEDGEQQSTRRQFGFFMMTDGEACSFHYSRPKRAAAPRYTPETVPFKPGKTVFKAIDPGLRDIATVVELVPMWDTGGEDVDGREEGR